MSEAGEERVRILLVDDDEQVSAVIAEGLSSGRYETRRVGSLREARQALSSRRPDLLILDLQLPDGDGLKLAEQLRESGSDLPILILTHRDAVEQRVEGFTHGADDYLCKPFAVPELEARIQALLRRAAGGAASHVLTYRDIRLDLVKRMLTRGTIHEELSSREATLLAYLMQNAERVLERNTLLEQVWGDEADHASNVLNVYVNYLRNKIEKGIYPRVIHTLRGRGYILSEEPPEDADASA